MGGISYKGIMFEVERRKVKYSRIEFNPQGLRLIVPQRVKPITILKKNHRQIIKKYQKLKADIESARRLQPATRGERQFKQQVASLAKEYSTSLGVVVKEIKFRKMKRRWGSCRSNGIITLNRSLQFLPDRLLAYVIFHEILHLKITGHGRQFKETMASYFPGFRGLDRQLYLFGLRLLSKVG
jgi:predicted metal-dependent hydrolase